MASCPRPLISVRDYMRAAPRRKAKRASTAAYVVRHNDGRTVSRHRTLTAAVNARKRLDRQSFRQGKGRPYNVERAR